MLLFFKAWLQLQPCCFSLSCSPGLCLQLPLALEHSFRQGWQKVSKGKGSGEKDFWNSFSTTSPTPFIPASVPLHLMSLCRQLPVLHDEMSAWIPSLACFPAPQEERLHLHKAEWHDRTVVSWWGRRSAVFKLASLQRTERLPDYVSGRILEPNLRSSCGCIGFYVFLSLSYRYQPWCRT